MNQHAEKKGRGYFRFSLRSLLILMLIVAGPLGWQLHRARRQQDVVDWVQEMGGSVYYEVEVEDSSIPQWLLDLMGVDFFYSVESVYLNRAKVTDISRLKRLQNLRELSLSRSKVEDLSALSSLNKLVELRIKVTPVSDLSPLRNLHSLESLSIDGTQVTDLSPLADLHRLKRFYFSRTSVSDLSALSNKLDMTKINMTETPVADISAFANMDKLEVLDMRETKVTDLSPLAGKPNLNSLDLFDTPAVDLSPLVGSRQLSIELGGQTMPEFLPLDDWGNLQFYLYKYPKQDIPVAFEREMQRVRISVIWEATRVFTK